ncbi:hypothetical protein DN069_06145 [Streptacidiphilus pinicola]|uniref:Uncharacterized protein n=2 Tax=Streptacidiphilus pinicola TaxID=2219663 RepID=A0A2X0IPG0_9ACTN|nr:hypothetical protein DN069_06145 [Streptacidiphilus pinicola]
MGSDQHHDDASVPGDDGLRLALRRLADSAGGTPALSGAELRARAGHRRRRIGLAVVPSAAAAGLLVGVTAFALTGHHSTDGGPTTPAQSALPVAPRTSGAPTVPASGVSRAPGARASARPSGSPTATAASPSSRPVPPAPIGDAACAVPVKGESLVLLHALGAAGALRTGTDSMLSAIPVSCVHGRPVPSGPQQALATAPDVVVTTTAPLSSGSDSRLSSLQELVTELTGHPDQLFAVRRDASGLVTRLDEVYVR